jgi:hypothetical protein
MSKHFIDRNNIVFDEKIHWELQQSLPSIYMNMSKVNSDPDVYRYFFTRPLTSEEVTIFNNTLDSHIITSDYGVKIYKYIEDDSVNKDYTAVDYKVQTVTNLFPKRTFVRGELQLVEWFSDAEMTDLVIKTEIQYTRDPFGFATSRTTTRTWYDFDGNEMPRKKTTSKIYSYLEMIKEGKRRRGNIVDGVQIPTLAFLQEAAADPQNPYGLNSSTVLLIGREFMDRFEPEFSKFIDNSSSVTDIADPNFNRKIVVVKFEEAAVTTDTWLNFQPVALGGARILDYLVSEFSI